MENVFVEAAVTAAVAVGGIVAVLLTLVGGLAVASYGIDTGNDLLVWVGSLGQVALWFGGVLVAARNA